MCYYQYIYYSVCKHSEFTLLEHCEDATYDAVSIIRKPVDRFKEQNQPSSSSLKHTQLNDQQFEEYLDRLRLRAGPQHSQTSTKTTRAQEQEHFHDIPTITHPNTGTVPASDAPIPRSQAPSSVTPSLPDAVEVAVTDQGQMHQAKQQQPTRVVVHETTINLPLRMRARDVTPAKDALPGYLRPTRSQILKSHGRLTTDEASASNSTGSSPPKAFYTPRTRYSHSPQSSAHSFVTAREEQDSASDSGSVVHVDSRTIRARRTDRPHLTVNVPKKDEPTTSLLRGKRDWIAPLQCSPANDSPKSPSSSPKRIIKKRQTLPNLRSRASEPVELPAPVEHSTSKRPALPRLLAPSKEAREKTEERAAETGEHFDGLTRTEERRLASINLRMQLKGAGNKAIVKEASTEDSDSDSTIGKSKPVSTVSTGPVKTSEFQTLRRKPVPSDQNRTTNREPHDKTNVPEFVDVLKPTHDAAPRSVINPSSNQVKAVNLDVPDDPAILYVRTKRSAPDVSNAASKCMPATVSMRESSLRATAPAFNPGAPARPAVPQVWLPVEDPSVTESVAGSFTAVYGAHLAEEAQPGRKNPNKRANRKPSRSPITSPTVRKENVVEATTYDAEESSSEEIPPVPPFPVLKSAVVGEPGTPQRNTASRFVTEPSSVTSASTDRTLVDVGNRTPRTQSPSKQRKQAKWLSPNGDEYHWNDAVVSSASPPSDPPTGPKQPAWRKHHFRNNTFSGTAGFTFFPTRGGQGPVSPTQVSPGLYSPPFAAQMKELDLIKMDNMNNPFATAQPFSNDREGNHHILNILRERARFPTAMTTAKDLSNQSMAQPLMLRGGKDESAELKDEGMAKTGAEAKRATTARKQSYAEIARNAATPLPAPTPPRQPKLKPLKKQADDNSAYCGYTVSHTGSPFATKPPTFAHPITKEVTTAKLQDGIAPCGQVQMRHCGEHIGNYCNECHRKVEDPVTGLQYWKEMVFGDLNNPGVIDVDKKAREAMSDLGMVPAAR